MENVWTRLKKPLFLLAPMEDVTDTAFRQIIMQCGRPDLFFTEFTNTDGMFSTGSEEVSNRLVYSEIEKPLIAQIWGTNPDHFYQAAKKIAAMGYDGIDINMGCPERSVIKKGACAGLIENPLLAKEIIAATKKGAGSLSGIPVSVKTRIGLKEIITEEWAGFLLKQDIMALTIHGRTAKEMSTVPTHWDEIGKVVKLRNNMGLQTLIIGNGDIRSREEGLEKVKRYGVDGIMIGRGIFEDPFLFNEGKQITNLSVKERMDLYLSHIALFEKLWGKRKNFAILKKFCKVYIKGFEGASEFRTMLMESKNYNEMRDRITSSAFYTASVGGD